MPNPDNYNMSYRPSSYWGPKELSDHFSTTIKGELRRRAVVGELKSGHDVLESVVCDSLPADELRAVGAVHPWLMGGEYLPDFKDNELEIARVTLKSTTMDVISIRARRNPKSIAYSIVDEYDDPGLYHVTNPYRQTPISFRELIRLIDRATESGGLVDGFRNNNYEYGSDAERIYDFATVSSVFYPQLEQWYDEVNEEWLRDRREELEAAE